MMRRCVQQHIQTEGTSSLVSALFIGRVLKQNAEPIGQWTATLTSASVKYGHQRTFWHPLILISAYSKMIVQCSPTRESMKAMCWTNGQCMGMAVLGQVAVA